MIWNWILNSTWDSNYDWESLKKRGTITEITEEKNGFKTVTRTFVSEDGSERITQSESYPMFDEKKQQLTEIDNNIKKAVANENYEEAAKLKKEKEKLLKSKKPKQ